MAEPAAEGKSTTAPAVPTAYSPHAIHMLRTVQNNTLKMSQMADQKASILMGATFLVFSMAVGQALAGELPWSLGILAGFAFLSSRCAALAVLPRLSKALPPGSGRNLLFFGHYHERNEEEWTHDVLGELHADEGVFRLMLHDIYQNGQVLQRRKYRFLSYAYTLFVIGLVVTLAAFAIELAMAYA